jgi:hypothetical protein
MDGITKFYLTHEYVMTMGFVFFDFFFFGFFFQFCDVATLIIIHKRE